MADTLIQDEPDETLTSHNYDGIQEYDNPIPGWWSWIFLGTIAFAPLYIFWFHSPTVPRNLHAQFEAGKAANLKLQFGEIGTLEPTRENVLKYLHDDKWLAVGQSVFASNCASCHGQDASGGSSAPNMTDDFYIHVNVIDDIPKVISEGAKNGAMPAWGTKLHPNELLFAACYIAQLRGKNLPGGKAPEPNAKKIDPWPAADTAASAGEKK
jgi:cytochrome c oxidase cbb3-type subunit 3